MSESQTESLQPSNAAERLSTPSRVEEMPSSFARNVGLAGAVFFGVGLLLLLWNVIRGGEESRISFGPGMVRLWLLLGTLGLAYHGLRETEERLRRLYGFFAMALLSFGAMFVAFMLTAEGVRLRTAGESVDGAVLDAALAMGRWVGLGAAALVGLLGILFTLLPFVAACSDAEGESALTPVNFFSRLFKYLRGDVQVLAIGLLILHVFLAAACALLYGPLREMLRREGFGLDANLLVFGLLPYGLVSLLLGLLFSLIFQRNEADEAWRLSTVGLCGWYGLVATLATFATLGGDLIGLPDAAVPYGVILGIVGFLLLSNALKSLPSDSDLAYRGGWWLRALGLVVAAAALARSLYPYLAAEFMDRTDVPPFLVPTGFLLIVFGLLFAWLGHSTCSDSRLAAMINREVASYFYSPIGYVVIGGMVVIAWLAFFDWFSFVVERNMRTMPEPVVLGYFFGLYPVFALIIVVPMLTMRLLSEEQRTGTMEVLLTAPVDETQIVISKFFGSWIMFMLAWSIWLVFPLIFRAATPEPFDYRPGLSFFFGLSLMASAFLSMGLFCSSLTKNQIIAFLLGLAGMFVLLAPGIYLLNNPEPSAGWKEFLELISFLFHQIEFGRGQVHWKFVVFYVSFTVFWLFLTIKVLEARKWK